MVPPSTFTTGVQKEGWSEGVSGVTGESRVEVPCLHSLVENQTPTKVEKTFGDP